MYLDVPILAPLLFLPMFVDASFLLLYIFSDFEAPMPNCWRCAEWLDVPIPAPFFFLPMLVNAFFPPLYIFPDFEAPMPDC